MFLRASGDDLGQLIVDNRGRCEQTYTVTELPSVPPITIASGQMDGATLTVTGATWIPGLFAGHLLTPNRDQGAATLGDNAAYTVQSNSLDSITLADGTFASSAVWSMSAWTSS